MIKYQSPLFVIGGVKNLIWPVSAIAKEISKLFFKAQLIYIFFIVVFILSNFGKIFKSGVGAVRREKGEERGSARWARSKELKSVLSEGPYGTILGLNGQQPLYLPINPMTLNQNILVVGSAFGIFVFWKLMPLVEPFGSVLVPFEGYRKPKAEDI